MHVSCLFLMQLVSSDYLVGSIIHLALTGMLMLHQWLLSKFHLGKFTLVLIDLPILLKIGCIIAETLSRSTCWAAAVRQSHHVATSLQVEPLP